jgi:hypothetical protein
MHTRHGFPIKQMTVLSGLFILPVIRYPDNNILDLISLQKSLKLQHANIHKTHRHPPPSRE